MIRNKFSFWSFLCIVFFTQSCVKSQFKYQTPSASLIGQYSKMSLLAVQGYYDLTLSLPSHYDTTAKIDYTDVLQQAINKNTRVIMPNFPVLVNEKGLRIPSNRVVYFPEKAWVKFQGPALKKLDDVIKIYNAENVQLINPKVEGSKYSTIQQDGQWSAGIGILNSKNVTIHNLRTKDTYGDGLFIGSEDGGFSENITITGGWIDNARRNGLSITSGKNVVVNQLLISNTSGHDPEAGVDVEPSWEKDRIDNVVLKNIYTFNNKQAGIAVNMNALNVKTTEEVKTISLTIDGHIDRGSQNAFLTSLNQSENGNVLDAKGKILVKNSQWNNTRTDVFWTTPQTHRIEVEFDKIKIDDRQKSRKFQQEVQSKTGMKLR